MKKTHITEQKFADLDLLPQVIEGLEKKGFDYCTYPNMALPVLLTAKTLQARPKQVLVKRLRFLTATFNHLLKHLCAEGVSLTSHALTMAPTRELQLDLQRC